MGLVSCHSRGTANSDPLFCQAMPRMNSEHSKVEKMAVFTAWKARVDRDYLVYLPLSGLSALGLLAEALARIIS